MKVFLLLFCKKEVLALLFVALRDQDTANGTAALCGGSRRGWPQSRR
jgi:hypothetical protein